MCHMQYCEQTRYTRIARYLNEAERVKEPKEKKKGYAGRATMYRRQFTMRFGGRMLSPNNDALLFIGGFSV